MRRNRETVRLVPQPLNEVQQWIARGQHEDPATRSVELFPPCVAIWPLGHPQQGDIINSQIRKDITCDTQLTTTAIDNHQIRPYSFAAFRVFLLRALESWG